uniref:Isoform A of Putative gustatory receptor 28b n=1 Tax=Drosophila melanogaster TaxID=7227 RepID=Q9VM08-2|nr:gustatory receptor 28b, isoform A [Drosophila melanogaster]AAF52520.2 gustatory receptor 28b, isoform A [Drosophila melanogaster]|eukprot:NP_647614.2 gustatory receptor 28b, isoform A [Drosophila melanogaster]
MIRCGLDIFRGCRGRFRYWLSARDCYDSISLMVAIAFALGITPFLVRRNALGENSLEQSWYGFLNAIFRWLLLAYCYSYINLRNESLIGYFMRNHVSQISTRVHDVGGIIAAVFTFILPLLLRKYFLKSVKNMVQVDTQLERLRSPVNFNTVVGQVVLVILAVVLLDTVLLTTGLVCLAKMEVYASWQLTFIFVYELLAISITICMFCLMTRTVQRRITCLHKVLKNLAHQWDTRSLKAVNQKQRSLQCLDSFSMYTIVTKDPAEIIQESMEIHHLICEAAATANKYFTYQLLTIISIAFLIIVFDAYYVLETLLGKSKRESKFKTVEFVTFFSCQMILYLIAIISIVEGSNRAIKKSEKTGGIVHSLLNKTKSAEVKEKLQQFSMQLMHLKINFTAAGLFNIDRTLYFTISGALTTYLIILLQFTSNSPNNGYGNGSSCCETFNNMTNHTL